jgi:hypothetical protein
VMRQIEPCPTAAGTAFLDDLELEAHQRILNAGFSGGTRVVDGLPCCSDS